MSLKKLQIDFSGRLLRVENIRPFAFIQLGDHPWILQIQEKINPL